MDAFTAAYIEAALWASSDFDGTPLDQLDAELAPEARARLVEDAREFQDAADEALTRAYDMGFTPERAGHDFWLTRNHHGAGFWDRGLDSAGRTLTEMAQRRGSVDLYMGDDGLIYLSP